MKEEIQKFIHQDLLSGQHDVGLDEDLLLSGLVDSVGLMRLVEFIEQTLKIKVPPKDFTIENFGTVNALGDYLHAQSASNATE